MSKQNKATNIYILSIPRVPGEYKLGIHGGSLARLYQRYETSVHDVQVHYFFKNVDAYVVEQEILKENQEHRIVKRRTQRKSEWLKISLDTLLLDVMMELTNNPKGRHEEGLFIIDRFNRSTYGETTILEAVGHEIPLNEDYETSSEESDSDTSEELTADDQEVISDITLLKKALKDFLSYTQDYTVKLFHEQVKDQYKYLEPITDKDIQSCMKELGWRQASTCKGKLVYKQIIELD